jgi:hypothetical protein
VNQHILTLNRYAQLTNLQDSVVEVNEGIASNELGLLQDVQWEDRQTEANRGHYIHNILNGKILSRAVNKLESRAVVRHLEVSENNLPLTGNLRMQTPNRN